MQQWHRRGPDLGNRQVGELFWPRLRIQWTDWRIFFSVRFSSGMSNTRSYSISNTNELLNSKQQQQQHHQQAAYLNHTAKHRSTPYLSSLSSSPCSCMDSGDSVLLPSLSSPTFSLSTPSSTWNSRIVRKLNSIAHRFNARSYSCLISPDRTKLLITPDYEDKHSYSHQTHEVTVIFDIKTYAILRITPAREYSKETSSEKE